MTKYKRTTGYNSTYPKVAVQWLNQALCFYQSLCLVDSEVLRNRHLRVAANRYRQALQEGTLIQKEGVLYILFEKPQRGITPGQFAAWYQNDGLIGSGIIAE